MEWKATDGDDLQQEHGISTSSSPSSAHTVHPIPVGGIPASAPVDVEKQASQAPKSTLSNVLSHTLSRTVSRTSTLEPGPPPDGGRRAWTQAFMGHIVIFTTWGYINSYGVFQNHYTSTLPQTPSAIAWIGSVQIFFLFFVGTLSGRMTDAGLFRLVFAIGTVAQLLGIFMTSLCTEYWQLFLAQGVLTGIGNGFLFCPTLALASSYFTKKRSLAIGIAASGSATGGMVFPALIEQLLPRIGFAWTIRVIGFIVLGLQIIAGSLLKPRLPPRRTGPLLELRAFSEPPYALFTLGMFLVFWGLYPGFYYIGEYASSVLHLSRSDSIYILLCMNGMGFVGRLVPAYLADRYTGPLNLLIPTTLASGIIFYTWSAVSDRGGVYVFACLYGFFAAGISSLFPATLSSLTDDVKKTGVRMGMVFTCISFACLTGSPIAGALITSRGWTSMICYAGTVFMAGGLVLGLARLSKTGSSWKVRV
jgi:predicted MFS family arabinose efflux permease